MNSEEEEDDDEEEEEDSPHWLFAKGSKSLSGCKNCSTEAHNAIGWSGRAGVGYKNQRHERKEILILVQSRHSVLRLPTSQLTPPAGKWITHFIDHNRLMGWRKKNIILRRQQQQQKKLSRKEINERRSKKNEDARNYRIN